MQIPLPAFVSAAVTGLLFLKPMKISLRLRSPFMLNIQILVISSCPANMGRFAVYIFVPISVCVCSDIRMVSRWEWKWKLSIRGTRCSFESPRSWTPRTTDSKYTMCLHPQMSALNSTAICELKWPLIRLPCRSTLMAGVQSTTIGWRQTAPTCTLSGGVRKLDIHYSTLMVKLLTLPHSTPVSFLLACLAGCLMTDVLTFVKLLCLDFRTQWPIDCPGTGMSHTRMQWRWTHQGTSLRDPLHVRFSHLR